jgi:serine/threonine-protein kinase
MERLEGETLAQRLVAVRALSVGETAAIVVQVCRAVTKAHEAGLVHRDLKPENIFLARDVGMEVAKVLDFGVVKVPDALALDGVSPTVTGTLIGTPCYMSPEQAQGLKSVDFRSDLWSLGVIVYECVTGIRPFARSALAPLIRQITIERILMPSESAPAARLPPAIDTWMARALSRDPSRRFASARELGESLERIAKPGRR